MSPLAHTVLRVVSLVVLIGLTAAPRLRPAIHEATHPSESERVVSER